MNFKSSMFAIIGTLSIFSQNANADSYCYDNNQNNCCSQWYAIYENVIVSPYFTRNNAYFLEDPPGTSGQQAVQFDWDYCYSPRVELGWNGNCCVGARVRYWHFDGDNEIHAVDSNGDIATYFADDSISPEIGFDNSSEANFRHDLELNVLDLEATVDCGRWTYSGGLRYAKIEQEYLAENISASDVVNSNHDFKGWGLTMAAEYLQPIKCGFSFFTKGRGSLLYGSSDWKAFNPDSTSHLSSSNDNDLQAIGELQIGIDWRTCFCGDKIGFIRIAGEAQYWANGGAAGPGCNAVFDEGNYQNSHPQDSSLGFIGVNVALGVIF